MNPQEVLRFCPRCKNELNITDNKRLECASCGFVTYITTWASSCLMILNPAGEILLVERKNDPQAGFLDLPGGFIELAETAQFAAIREAKEETGVDLKLTDLEYFTSAYDRYLYQGVNWYTLGMIFKVQLQAQQKLHSGDDAKSLQFFPLREVPYERLAYSRVKDLIIKLIHELDATAD